MLPLRVGAVAIALLSMSTCGLCTPEDQYSRGVDWLSRYGYLQRPDGRMGRLQTKQDIETALREMQRFAGLKETGMLDEATLRLMSTPRCSLPDIVRAEDMLKKRRKRRKRYTLFGSRWQKNEITWSLDNYPSQLSLPSENNVKTILTYALKAWSDFTPLNFRLVSNIGRRGTEHADIRVSFKSRLHDDGYPFDGRGGTLAHAFFPTSDSDIAGDTHFDDDEAWSYGGDSSSTDLFTVAVHEFGHALGLSHSSTEPSIMWPYYQGAVGDMYHYTLPRDDMLGIQALYGKGGKTPRPGAPPTPRIPLLPNPPPSKPTQQPDPTLPDRCNGGYDAVANIRGEAFFFKDQYFWRIQQSGSLVSLTPSRIQNFWMGLPPETKKIDAVYERSDSHIVFFIGNQYWVFKDTVSLPGYPRPLSEWGMQASDGKPVKRVDAVFVWPHNGKTYLFSKGQFWRFTEEENKFRKNPDSGYPHDATQWTGMPSDPDAVMSWKDGKTYFFKGNSYWIHNSKKTGQEALAAKSTGVDWMRCPKPPPGDDSCTCSFTGDSAVKTVNWLLLNFSVSSIIFLLNVIW